MAVSNEEGALVDQLVAERAEDEAGRTAAAQVMGPQAIVDERGGFGAEFSGLFAMFELKPLPMDGLTEAEADELAHAFEKQVVNLDSEFSLNWYLDRGIAASPEDLIEVPDAAPDNVDGEDLEAREVMRALQESRKAMLAGKRELHNRFLASLEMHGNFAFGGAEVHWPEAFGAGFKGILEKDPIKREELFLQFKSLWPGSDTAIKNILAHRMQDDLDSLFKQGRRFFEVLNSEIQPRLIPQAFTDPTGNGLGWKQLDPIEGAKALYALGDPHPRRRKNFWVPDSQWGRLADLLTAPTIDFQSLYGRRTTEGHVYKTGQIAVGGVPRKIYSIRLLPKNVPSGFFDWMTQFPHALTLRIHYRNMGVKERDSEVAELEKALSEAQMSMKDLTSGEKQDGEKATTSTGEAVVGEGARVSSELTMLRGRDTDGRKLGWLTILVALSGFPTMDDKGREISAEEDLENACDALEKKFEGTGVSWAEEIDRQDLAYLMMFPGKTSFHRLERMRCHSDVFAAVVPMRESFIKQPEITEMEPTKPFLMTGSRCGRHDLVSLISGKTLACLVIGETGGGKSFWTNAAGAGFYMVGDTTQVDIIEAGGSLAETTEAAGGSVVYVGDPALVTDKAPNPFDWGDLGEAGYPEKALNDLQNFVQALIGWDAYQPEERTVIRQALENLGKATVMDGTGVHSVNSFANQLTYEGPVGARLAEELDDFRSDGRKGRYAWLFPAVKDRTSSRFVDYVFPVSTQSDSRAEGLLLFAIIQKVQRRVDGTHPHLFILDEANRFLDMSVVDPKRRATAMALGRLLKDAATQWRKLSGGYLIITQSPNHLKNWDPGLVADLQEFLGTYVILPMKAEKDRSPEEEERGLDLLIRDGEAGPVKAAVRKLDRTKYEFLLVRQGKVQIKRLDESSLGRALFESGPKPKLIKRYIINNYPGTKLGKMQAFERGMNEVRAKRMTWSLVEQQLRGGKW